ncbi:hypothetical protein Dtox_3534 [Desulfofarcimen acetoxidans DSM 771]|jgi:hypothetical protein|uniref:Uncharacterized protein n=1 Tax=Desulfofarcimen acetoxidans (strain ATCC 49208 / DSM 771 / KCTC 5769 / VKM B-1644 / 5575) TaxID=485916 RepID=C8VVW3_DESAS|nr:hypothetical protein [Desulfofarcimen acetoxidans]ACV64250.1 hypothetical protein Dtox_3534 [Desulfofarcimen acetoxidans DSM 771]
MNIESKLLLAVSTAIVILSFWVLPNISIHTEVIRKLIIGI